MDYDEYEEVINGEATYSRIAEILNRDEDVIIGWTDGEGTHFDILFHCAPKKTWKFGHLQGGVAPTDLFVSIMRVGCFGFESNNTDTNAGYYSEKLRIGGSATSEKLAELINGVKKLLV